MYAGHVGFKKIVLEISWQVVRYLHKIGAVEGNDRAYLLYTPILVGNTMIGRIMQVMNQYPLSPPSPSPPPTPLPPPLPPAPPPTLRMQATSDSVGLAVALELFAVIFEVLEARDLLRSDTPLKKNKETVRYIGRQLSRPVSSRIDIAEGSSDGQAGQAEEAEFDDTDLRREFCVRVLITTQLAEGE